MKNIYLSAIILFTIILNAHSQAPAGRRGGFQMPKAKSTEDIKSKWFDVAYASQSPAQKLDIYLPNDGKGDFPVIVAIHGGAFKMGDKGDMQLNGMLEGLKRGYAIVSINYRMSGEAIFPAAVYDCKTAIRWIKANAKTYHLNPNKIATWGGSAGGHLAAMIGTSSGEEDLEDFSQGNKQFSSEVQAVVDWFGPINFNTMDAQFKISNKGKTDHDNSDSPESLYIGKKITEAPDLVKKTNPATYITKNDPPFFIEHGKEDQLVPTEQSIDFAADLEKILGKNKVTLTILPDTRHGGPQFETPENLDKVFQFLDKYLK
jgi:acetyl esterase/lipase